MRTKADAHDAEYYDGPVDEVFPDMSKRKNVTLGKRSGLFAEN